MRVIVLVVSLAAISLRCGVVSLGGGTPNASTPSNATELAQGSFSGTITGETVTGTAIVYSVNGSSGSYILRLQSLSTPSEANLEALVFSTTGQVATITLSSYTGNVNYTFSASSSAQFSGGQVQIFSVHNNETYSQAPLQ